MGEQKPIRVLVCALLVVGVGGLNALGDNLVANPGFESGGAVLDWPTGYGYWGGDAASVVVGENGITPRDGSKMLRADSTSIGGPSSSNYCQVCQVIDITSFAAMVAAGQAKATASTYVNRVAGDTQTDTWFDIAIYACAGLQSDFPNVRETNAYLAASYGVLEASDADTATWEQVQATLDLPANTDYVAIRLAAYEDVYNDTSFPEFDGHYIDSTSAEVTPEPVSAVVLLGPVVVLLRRRRG